MFTSPCTRYSSAVLVSLCLLGLKLCLKKESGFTGVFFSCIDLGLHKSQCQEMRRWFLSVLEEIGTGEACSFQYGFVIFPSGSTLRRIPAGWLLSTN